MIQGQEKYKLSINQFNYISGASGRGSQPVGNVMRIVFIQGHYCSLYITEIRNLIQTVLTLFITWPKPLSQLSGCYLYSSHHPIKLPEYKDTHLCEFKFKFTQQ